MAVQYSNHFTWSHPYGEHVICHSDGVVSVAIGWSGFDNELTTKTETANDWSTLYTLLAQLKEGYCVEFHFWRETDASKANEYLALNKKIVRGHDLAIPVREAIAEHIGSMGMANRVALVLTLMPRRGVSSFKAFLTGPKGALLEQGSLAEELLITARGLANKLPGGYVKPFTEYAEDIIQSIYRDYYLRGNTFKHDPQLLLNEQLIAVAPRQEFTEGSKSCRLRHGEQLSKILLVWLLPDADPAWFLGMAALSIPYHVSQILVPIDRKKSLKESEKEADIVGGSTGNRGHSMQDKTVDDLVQFQKYVAANNLAVFQSAYIIHLHGTPEELEHFEARVTDWVEGGGGQVRAESFIQAPYFRVGQPGQGYCCPKFRPQDHLWQLANMAPVQVYKTGAAVPESLRLTQSGTLVGFNISKQEVPHSLTIAMTRGGKGVEKVAQIVETYPFGVDWYIAEIGSSYKWVVEGFGGVYSKIDPSETVVNPLPPYSVANPHSNIPLDAKLVGGTVNALAFLLTDGDTNLTIHQAAAAQSALQLLYAVPNNEVQAPTLPDFLVELEASDLADKDQQDAAKKMARNLNSFLETTEGRIFARQDNLILSEGITGVDLKDVDRASPKLLNFYLVFLALRFSHLSFARRTMSKVLLDEMHKFVAIAPKVMGRLISELARMGGKEAAGIDLVTQGMTEIDIIEKEVVNSMPFRTLLYRPDEWEAIGNRINMPPGPLDVWKKYPYPVGLDYRPGMRSDGEQYFDLHLTFPDLLLDLASTTSGDLNLKDEIGLITANPMERLLELRRRKEGRK